MTLLQTAAEPNYLGAVLLLLFLGALYLMPTIIAMRRGHHQTAPIVVVNVVFGWTLVGWIAALAWSVSALRT